MPYNGYFTVFVKIFAAIVSAVAFTLYGSWRIYTPVADRLRDTDYSSFSGLFAIQFAPNFIVFLLLGVVMSPMVDRFIYKKYSLGGIRGIFTLLFVYLLLGFGGGVIVSVFFYRIHFVFHYIVVSMSSVLLFLFFQIVFQLFFFKIVKH